MSPSGTAPAGLPVAIDTTALVRRYLHGPDRELVVDTMAAASAWCASGLVRAEVLLALQQAAVSPASADRLWAAARADWEWFWVAPIDSRALARAVEVGARFGLRTVDALHLAALDRLPRPAAFLTFDRRQIPAAAALGFQVVSPLG
jgi:hypothetical protein